MTKLAALRGWEMTAHSLHRATQILGALRMFALEPVPNYLELSTVIRPAGLSTGELAFGEVQVDFKEVALIYQPLQGVALKLPLAGNTQATLLEKLLTAIEAHNQILDLEPNSSRSDAFMLGLAARKHPFLPERKDLLDEKPFEIDPALSAAYADTLYRVFSAVARFRARLNGPMTPVVVWSEHFDLSFLWFATAQASEKFAHMNFGFAPFSADLPRPYLYAYAWPMPAGFEQLSLPKSARWNTVGWQGVVVPYDELINEAEPEVAIEQICLQIFDLLALSLGGETFRSA